MIKYYKTDEKGPLLYKEAWFDEQKKLTVIHHGKVGHRGTTLRDIS